MSKGTKSHYTQIRAECQLCSMASNYAFIIFSQKGKLVSLSIMINLIQLFHKVQDITLNMVSVNTLNLSLDISIIICDFYGDALTFRQFEAGEILQPWKEGEIKGRKSTGPWNKAVLREAMGSVADKSSM